jgi:hypothetical protein
MCFQRAAASAIQVDDCRLRFSENTDEDNGSSEVGDLKRIEGKLIAVEPPWTLSQISIVK